MKVPSPAMFSFSATCLTLSFIPFSQTYLPNNGFNETSKVQPHVKNSMTKTYI